MNNYINLALKLFTTLGMILLLITFTFNSWALPAPDSKGTDFWLMFNTNLNPDGLTLFITGEINTTGTVSIPGLAFSTPFSVTAGVVTSVPIPLTAEMATFDGIEDKGIHVVSVDEVTVYGLNRRQYTTDAFLGLPTDILGNEYIVLGYSNTTFHSSGATLFGIVATENTTTVTITPSVTTGPRTVGVPYSVVLNQGQAYQLANPGQNTLDLSGTLITSDKPISVFGGNRCTNIPPVGYQACDHVIEQLPPISAWGKSFVTVPLATRFNGDTFRVIAAEDNTNVAINGTAVPVLNKGQLHEQLINAASVIAADKPVLVAQYSNSSSYDGVTSDPFMMLIPPFEQFLGAYTITTPATGFAQNFANIVAPSADVGNIMLDGVAIPAGSFTAIGASGFSGAQVPISLGSHNFLGNLAFGCFVYGFDSYDSYGYPGGQSLAPIATVTSVALSPKSATNPVNTEHCVTALVTDNFGNPVVGVRVDFNVNGVNPGTGFANTVENGTAAFCYTGINVGTDKIFASVGTLIDSASKVWTGDMICPYSQGYWKNHPEEWPVNSLMLGSITYDKTQLLSILNTPIGDGRKADASLILAHQLIAAKLNIANGTDPAPISTTVASADALIGSRVLPIRPKKLPSSVEGKMMVTLASTLDEYNNGYLIAGCVPVVPYTNSIYDQGVPSGYNLETNYPNPFNPTTTIGYSLPTMSTVKLAIYDFLGCEIAVLVDRVEDAGYKSVEWNAVKTLGSQLASGTYFYRLEATDINDFFNHFKEVRKMFLVK